MKIILRTGLVAILSLSLCGCIVQSINPFYTEEAVIEIPSFNGEWMRIPKKGDEKPEKAWIFVDGDIHTHGNEGGAGTLRSTYFRVGELVFMDTAATEADHTRVSGWYEIHTAAVHILCKVESGNNRLTLTPIDCEWLSQALNKKIVSFPGPIREENDYALFNVPSEDWMRFLHRYGSDPEAFSEKNKVEFVRPTEPQK